MRLPSPALRLVLVMVSLVVQMVGGAGDAGVVRQRGDGMGDPYEGGGVAGGTVCQGESVDDAAFGGVAEGGAGVVGDVLVASACGSRSQVVNRAMPPVRLVLVVSVTVRLRPFVRAVWLSCQASVLVTLMVVCWRLVLVVVLR